MALHESQVSPYWLVDDWCMVLQPLVKLSSAGQHIGDHNTTCPVIPLSVNGA